MKEEEKKNGLWYVVYQQGPCWFERGPFHSMEAAHDWARSQGCGSSVNDWWWVEER